MIRAWRIFREVQPDGSVTFRAARRKVPPFWRLLTIEMFRDARRRRA